MIQVPTPPAPPVPPDVPHIPDLPIFWTADDVTRMVIISLAGAAVLMWIVARGPIGHAIGEVLKRWLGGARTQALPGEMEALRTRLDNVQRQLGELAERQDFTERMLAQVRRDKALPGGADVPG